MDKNETVRLLAIQGRVKGVVFETDCEYVNKKWGPKGVMLVEQTLRESGCNLEYAKVRALNWYPVGLRAASLLAIKEQFNLTDEDLKIMGNTAPKFSFIVKLMMKFFLSPKMTIEHSPDFWKKHYEAGRMETEYHGDEQYALVKLFDFDLHPVVCRYLEGYFQRIMLYSTGKEVKSSEIECAFNGKAAHVFKLSWA
ncbi:hypothetical protein HZC35_04065 [Candidatus Saganbacteria bacterium]|nr:hypothetical protein [Candidatus Saganbacteria bacterium]